MADSQASSSANPTSACPRWKRVLRCVGWMIVVLYFVFGSLVIAGRWFFTTQIDHYRDDVSQWVSQAMGILTIFTAGLTVSGQRLRSITLPSLSQITPSHSRCPTFMLVFRGLHYGQVRHSLSFCRSINPHSLFVVWIKPTSRLLGLRSNLTPFCSLKAPVPNNHS